jgi:hypothetical protein
VDSSNTLSVISPGISFRDVKWADSSYGVAQDNSGNLYVIDGAAAQAINLPSGIQPTRYLQYAVTKSHEIYLGSGSNLYIGNQSGFKKIVTDLKPASLLVAGRQALAWIDDGDASGEEAGPSITVVDNGNKTIRSKIGSFVGAWSDNDTYLAISSQNGGEILNKSLNSIARIPQSSFKNPAWLSDSRLVYSNNGQLWLYDVASHQASMIGNSTVGETIKEVDPSQDGSYIYMVVQGINGNRSVRRVALNGSAVSPTLAKLTVFLPIDLPECTAGYINFSRLGVLVRPFNVSQVNQCLNDVKTNLTNDQIDTNTLTFSVGPTSI